MARCSDVCITPTRVGCTARLLRPACDGRTRRSDACRITNLLRRGLPCSLISLYLQRQSSPLRCMPHHTPTLA
eukprot:scaffold25001_cov57-Phaeocystis_antarctica.AAC.3